MNLVDILKLKFPDADMRKDIRLQDDGQGPYIKEWNLDAPQPSEKDIVEWSKNLQQDFSFYQNKMANEPIYKQLAEIDARSIRALRISDEQKLSELEQEAIALRAQLLPTE